MKASSTTHLAIIAMVFAVAVMEACVAAPLSLPRVRRGEALAMPRMWSGCPCNVSSLCDPIQAKPRKEVYAFMTSSDLYDTWDWNKITSVAFYGDTMTSELYCHAKAHGARVIHATSYPVTQLTNHTYRRMWIKATMDFVLQHSLDGINMDFESNVEHAPRREGLTLVMVELASALRPAIKGGGQLSLDAPFSPLAGERRFDYASLAVVCDFLVIMDYDLWWPGIKDCHGGPNSPIGAIRRGFPEFMAVFNDSAKFVLGVPWYGHSYGCTNAFDGPGTPCMMNCKAEVNSEIPYAEIEDIKHNTKLNTVLDYVENTSNKNNGSWAMMSYVKGALWETSPPGPGGWRQVWFDTPNTTMQKYAYAKAANMGGISMWNVNCLSVGSPGGHTRREAERKAMWDAMDTFLNP